MGQPRTRLIFLAIERMDADGRLVSLGEIEPVRSIASVGRVYQLVRKH